ncbi:MAG: prepilin-type N-terminal cleavage/methylation domain-containing protein [Pseudomonadota bacterium]|nr:prepilin-type N-terminal cleavage/methylation domain-containing protein [Pseudomonadota bacterium]
MQKIQRGFTLIEIAIVLVIIGLLLGGVLKGQELIESGKIKRAITDYNGTSAAFYGYLDRYGFIPGDDGTAAARWNGVFGNGGSAQNGNADGDLDGEYEATGNEDTTRFWQHLRAAGFITGSMQTPAIAREQPINRYGGIIGVENVGAGLAGNIVCQSNIPAKGAIAIDTQMDDGTGNAGSMRAIQGAGNINAGNANTAGATIVDDGSTTYLLCRSL